MSDETPDSEISNTAASALGGVLRAARESVGLSVEEVAQQLRMSAHQVKALEEDNLIVLSSPAFVRGFIRNYARLLKVPAEPLIAAYKAMQPEDNASVAIGLKSENIAIVNTSRRTMLMYLLASLLVVVGGISWWAYQDWRESKPSAPVAAVKPLVKAQEAEPTPPPMLEPIVQMPAVVPDPTPVAAPEVVVAQDDIRLTFTEQTWVSITDSTGKEVFNKTKPAETEDFANGTPPFNVVVGNAVGVLVFYKGKPFDIYPYTKANVARFTLE
ncbi:MAG: helix-turn-helix domain-containing protein [Methylophilaceae bacterium]